uniref:Uncharacterized protein n=1 Tax=Romanomermis culicivorax TaxID=13658 RepID=A0A915I3C9_ROMCU
MNMNINGMASTFLEEVTELNYGQDAKESYLQASGYNKDSGENVDTENNEDWEVALAEPPIMSKSAKAAFSPTDDNFSDANADDPHGSTSPVMSATISEVLLQPILDMQAIVTPAIDKADHFKVITSQMDKIMQLLLQMQCQIINQKQQMDNLESGNFARKSECEWDQRIIGEFHNKLSPMIQAYMDDQRDDNSTLLSIEPAIIDPQLDHFPVITNNDPYEPKVEKFFHFSKNVTGCDKFELNLIYMKKELAVAC